MLCKAFQILQAKQLNPFRCVSLRNDWTSAYSHMLLLLRLFVCFGADINRFIIAKNSENNNKRNNSNDRDNNNRDTRGDNKSRQRANDLDNDFWFRSFHLPCLMPHPLSGTPTPPAFVIWLSDYRLFPLSSSPSHLAALTNCLATIFKIFILCFCCCCS